MTTGPAPRLPAPRLPALDGLRGLAVLGVVAFHAGYLTGGFLGVDLFFTLSGFLITSLLLAEIESTAAVDLRHFWSRRARRLLPAVLVLVAFVPLYMRLWATPFEQANLRGDALGTLAYVANWRQIAQGTEYWAHFSAPSPLQHTWSLAIEEQFYVLFPFLVLLAVRWGVGTRSVRLDPVPAARRRAVENRLLLLAGALGVVSALWMVLASLRRDAVLSELYFSTQTRFASILVGVGLAALAKRLPRPTGNGRVGVQAAAIVAMLVLAAAWTRVAGTDLFVYRGGLVLCAVAAVVIIFAILQPGTTPLHRVLSLRPLVWVGLVSYGIYLWHWPVFVVLTPERTHLDGLSLLTVRLVVTLAFVVPSYYLLENPIRRGRLVSAPQARVLLPAAGVVLIGLLLLPTANPGTDVERYLRPVQIPVAWSSPTGRARPQVLLLGDSVPDSLAPALTEHPGVLGVDVRSLAKPACSVWPELTRIRLLDGTVRDDGAGCADLLAGWPREARAQRTDVAILMLGLPGQIDREIDGRWVPFCAEAQRAFRARLGEALDSVHTEVARVVLTTTAQRGPGPRHGERADDVDCVNASYAEVAASRPWLHVVDLAAHVCPDHVCIDEIEGNVLRPDGLHYAGASAAIVGTWVIEQSLRAVTAAP